MFEVDGGTQALRRTMIYTVRMPDRASIDFSVPDELGALVLKGAAHMADRRDRERHLFDAAVLSACITDHAAEIERLGGSDRKRIAHLAHELADPRHKAWVTLDAEHRAAGQDTLRILSAEPRRRTAFRPLVSQPTQPARHNRLDRVLGGNRTGGELTAGERPEGQTEQ
jgi:hypothetical protein